MPPDLSSQDDDLRGRIEASGDRRVHRIERLARLLDDRFRLPGTRYSFGLDGLIGLVPVVGDAATFLISSYLIAQAGQLGLARRTRLRMVWNLVVDLAAGSVPLVGDLFDFAWKANRKNVELLLRDVAAKERDERT